MQKQKEEAIAAYGSYRKYRQGFDSEFEKFIAVTRSDQSLHPGPRDYFRRTEWLPKAQELSHGISVAFRRFRCRQDNLVASKSGYRHDRAYAFFDSAANSNEADSLYDDGRDDGARPIPRWKQLPTDAASGDLVDQNKIEGGIC